MNTPLISFIVPSYNFAPHISECVNSILQQEMRDLEVIVVNDGSTDNTKEVLEGLARQDCRVVPINKDNEGVSVARNTGLAVAKGEYVSFVDADDYLAPDYANYMLGLCKVSNSEFGLSTDSFTKQGENQVDKESIKTISPTEATALLLSPRIIVGCWNKIFKRAWLQENKIVFSSDLFYGEGLHFIINAAQHSTSVTVGNRKVYYYRRNNYSSATTTFSIEKMYNGLKSLDMIHDNLFMINKDVNVMWRLHRSLFCMGAVVRIVSCGVKMNYKKEYKEWLSYLRSQTKSLIFERIVPTYRKLLLVGTSISPQMMAALDKKRRDRIAKQSV